MLRFAPALMSSSFNFDTPWKREDSKTNSNSNTAESCIPQTTIEDFLKNISIEFYNKCYPILKENGITDLKYLANTSNEMLEELATDLLHLNFVEKLKFYASIKELNKNSVSRNVFTSSVKEWQIMSNIHQGIKNMTEVQKFITNKVINKLQNNVKSQLMIIDDTFDKIVAELQLRREELKRILNDEWKDCKLQEIRNETKIVAEYEQYLKQQLLECETLLNNKKYFGNQRERRMIEIESNIDDQKQFSAYEDPKSILQQLNKMRQLKQISFTDNLDINGISKFGCFQTLELGMKVELEISDIKKISLPNHCKIKSVLILFCLKNNIFVYK